MEKQDVRQRELQLLPASAGACMVLPPPSRHEEEEEEVDLQLSIGKSSAAEAPKPPRPDGRQIEALRWQAAEQMRMAGMEKAYAERVRELTRRELELAQAELSRARMLWERARDDLARAELLKQNARLHIPAPSSSSSIPIQITCHSCRHPFRP